MRRFYIDKGNICDNLITFSQEESQHISKVLRLELGENVIVSSGDGIDLECVLTSVSKPCTAKIISKKENPNEPKVQLVLFQSVIKNEKMDYAIQKATEIGISQIVPVLTERTVVKVDNKAKQKQEHWQKIAIEACKQCGRAKVPKVLEPMKFSAALKLFEKFQQKIIAYEDEHTLSISESVETTRECAYFIGPEGGFTDEEHDALVDSGAKSVSLGKRILRAETAAVVCGAVILCLMGEMNV